MRRLAEFAKFLPQDAHKRGSVRPLSAELSAETCGDHLQVECVHQRTVNTGELDSNTKTVSARDICEIEDLNEKDQRVLVKWTKENDTFQRIVPLSTPDSDAQ